MTPALHTMLHKPLLYRVSIGYVASVAVLIGVSAGAIQLSIGVYLLGFVFILIMLIGARQEAAGLAVEVDKVHTLVNSTHTALIARVDTLTAALVAAGVEIPADPMQPQTSAVEDRRG